MIHARTTSLGSFPTTYSSSSVYSSPKSHPYINESYASNYSSTRKSSLTSMQFDSPSPTEDYYQSKEVNPYSSSLWYYLRGDNGEEIKDMQRKTRNKRNLEIQILDPKSRYYQEGSPNKRFSPATRSNGLLRDFEIPEISNPPSALIPNYETYYSPHSSIGRLLSEEQNHLEMLRQYEALIQSFNAFLRQNSIIMKKSDINTLFGNHKNMISVIELFLEKITIRTATRTSDETDRDKVICDYVNRLSFVYASNFQSTSRRYQLLRSIKYDPRFEKWDNLASFNDNFIVDKLILRHMESLRNYLISANPAEFEAATNKLDTLAEQSEQLQKLSRTVPSNESEMILINIPSAWKKENKNKWHEISKEQEQEYQATSYLFHQFKKSESDFKTVINQMSKQFFVIRQSNFVNKKLALTFSQYSSKLEIDKLEHSNDSACMTPKTLLFMENSIQSAYQLYSEKVGVNLILIKDEIDNFEKSMKQRTEEMNGLNVGIKMKFKKLLKKSYHMEREVRVENLFKICEFMKFQKEFVRLLFMKFQMFIVRYLEILKGPASASESYKEIIEEFFRLRMLNGHLVTGAQAGGRTRVLKLFEY